jgi:LPXTG-motif cell wall-anchored protein
VKKKKKALSNWFMLFLLLGSYLQFLLNVPLIVRADNTSESAQTLIDTDGFKADAEIQEVKEGCQLTLHFQKAASEQPKRIKINIQADGKNLTAADLQNTPEVKMEDTEKKDWIQTAAFSSEESQSKLVFFLPEKTAKLTARFQIDQQEESTIKTDMLTGSEAKPRDIQMPVTTSEDSSEAAAVSSTTSSEPASIDSNPETSTESTETTTETDTMQAAETSGELPSDKTPIQKLSGDANDNIQEPTGNAVSAIGLKLSPTTFADLKIHVDNYDNVNSYIRSKTNQLPSGQNYDQNDQNSMLNYANGLYEPGSSARVVVFDHKASGELKSVIQADYDTVGTVVSPSGEVIPVGAYVEVSNLHLRNSDWGSGGWNNQEANAVGIDFSNNFYSGISLANIKYFDWKVVFYETATHQPIDFETVDDNYAQLTFTSLNPGEFVNKFSTADNNPAETPIEDQDGDSFVKPTYFNDDTAVPGGKDGSNHFSWPQNGDKSKKGHFGYTAHTWGDYEAGAPTDEENDEWNDHIGSSTFGRGAVGYKLSGTTHEFTRGTYSQNPAAWFANASGSVSFIIPTNPPLFNVKKVSNQAVAGGGSQAPVYSRQNDKPSADDPDYQEKLKAFKSSKDFQDFAASWVPDAASINEQNVNEQAEANQPIYYYISQGLYSLVGDAIVKPSKITFEDTLPEGTNPKEVKLYDTTGKEMNVAEKTISGRKVTMTLTAKEIDAIQFARGYITVRIEADLSEKPETLDAEKIMNNSGTFKMLDSKDRVKYDETTNIVTVNENPPKPAEIPIRLIKKSNIEGMDLEGAAFELRKDGKVAATAVTDSNGQVDFVSDGQPYQLTAGEYSIKETKAIPGHKQDEKEHAFSLDKNLQLTCADGSVTKQEDQLIFTDTNYWKKTDLTFKKTDNEGNNLAGAVFRLTGDNLDSGEVTTDAQGILSFKELDLQPAGTYTLEEIKAPAGYFLPENPTWTLTFTKDGRKATLKSNEGNTAYSDTQHIVFNDEGNNRFDFEKNPITNEKQTVRLSVFKEDSLTKKRLKGAVFTLDSASGTVNQTTDESGVAVFTELETDKTYILKETQAPNGYLLSQQTYTVFFDEDSGNWIIQDGEKETKISSGKDKELSLSITVPNEAKTPLPHTGGIGKGIFMSIGFLLIFGAALWFYQARKKQEVA